MKIVDEDYISFDDLLCGDVFKFSDLESVYMKIFDCENHVGYVNLFSGYFYLLPDDEWNRKVILYEAELSLSISTEKS